MRHRCAAAAPRCSRPRAAPARTLTARPCRSSSFTNGSILSSKLPLRPTAPTTCSNVSRWRRGGITCEGGRWRLRRACSSSSSRRWQRSDPAPYGPLPHPRTDKRRCDALPRQPTAPCTCTRTLARTHTLTCSMPTGGGGSPKLGISGSVNSLGYTSSLPATILIAASSRRNRTVRFERSSDNGSSGRNARTRTPARVDTAPRFVPWLHSTTRGKVDSAVKVGCWRPFFTRRWRRRRPKPALALTCAHQRGDGGDGHDVWGVGHTQVKVDVRRLQGQGGGGGATGGQGRRRQQHGVGNQLARIGGRSHSACFGSGDQSLPLPPTPSPWLVGWAASPPPPAQPPAHLHQAHCHAPQAGQRLHQRLHGDAGQRLELHTASGRDRANGVGSSK